MLCRSPGDQAHEFPLAVARPGLVTIARIGERLQNDDEALRLLARTDLIPERGITVIGVWSETIIVLTPHGECVIPISVAEQVWAASNLPSAGAGPKSALLEDQSAVGARAIETVERVLDVLQGPPTDAVSEWSSRYRRFAAQLQFGDPIAVARACRDLWALKVTDTLGPGEDLLLRRAFRALTAAVGAAANIPGPEAQRRILEALA